MNANNVLENFVDDYTYMTRVQPDFGILTYTFHPHVIGRGHRMMMLERLIQKLMDGGAVFMTMEAAMDEWLARQQSGRKAAARAANVNACVRAEGHMASIEVPLHRMTSAPIRMARQIVTILPMA